MRHPVLLALCIACTALAACQRNNEAEVKRAIDSVTEVDQANLNEIMLTVGDPNEAVTYFKGAVAANPQSIDTKRMLAKSLNRAGKPTEAVVVWTEVVNSPDGTNADRVELAGTYIRVNNWDQAAAMLNQVPPTYETYERYRYEAMVADSQKQWKKADSFYEIAAGLTTQPAGIYNNWGFSKLTRQDYSGAERLFLEALTYDPGMFTAKNNLILARGAQGKYDMPVIQMTQKENSELLYTLALTAIKRGDVNVGKQLLQLSIDTNPQYFEAAERSLAALDG